MEDNKENAVATEPVAAQPDATGTPPAKSAAETKLEASLKKAKGERDTYKHEAERVTAALRTLQEQYDALGSQFEESQRQLAERITGTVLTAEPEATAATEAPSEEEQIKAILKRNGLEKCYMLTSGPCFSETHAREFAGEEFNSLTVITAE